MMYDDPYFDYADVWGNDNLRAHIDCLILLAMSVKSGDIVYINDGGGNGVQKCVLVNSISTDIRSETTELDCLHICGDEELGVYMPTKIYLSSSTKVGILRGYKYL